MGPCPPVQPADTRGQIRDDLLTAPVVETFNLLTNAASGLEQP
tara:strand:+ start:2581 stop:2709 length:129 start_codon:yes stop_codon:yes gene_type:complete